VEFSDFTTPEYATYDRVTPKKWEATRGLGFSFGYNQVEGPEHVLSEDKLIDMLADIVSKNGNLLLAVGPRGDGSIPELQAERLRALGKWLRQNGEAIYGTRPWVAAEGKTPDGGGIRFTKKGDAVYAILLDRPKGPAVVIERLNAADNTTVQLLGVAGNLKWTQQGRNVAVDLPASLPGDYAWALKITPRPWRLMND
jgi:alpha-L-fucosidase